MVRNAVVSETALLRDTGVVHARETLKMDFHRLFPQRIAQTALPLALVRPNVQNRLGVWRDGGKAEQFTIADLQYRQCRYPRHRQQGPGPLQTHKPLTVFMNFCALPALSLYKITSCKMLVPSTVTDFSDNQRSPVIVKWSLNIKGTTALLSQSGIVSPSLAGKKMSGLNLNCLKPGSAGAGVCWWRQMKRITLKQFEDLKLFPPSASLKISRKISRHWTEDGQQPWWFQVYKPSPVVTKYCISTAAAWELERRKKDSNKSKELLFSLD